MATTINKKYTITMTLSDGKTATADFTIPVACPTAAEVKCVTNWNNTTKDITYTNLQAVAQVTDSTTTYKYDKTYTYPLPITSFTTSPALVRYPGWNAKIVDGTNNQINISYNGTTSSTINTLTVKLNYDFSTVENRLKYLYAYHA